MRGVYKALIITGLVSGLLALLINDDRTNVGWSWSVLDVFAVCSIGAAAFIFVKFGWADKPLWVSHLNTSKPLAFGVSGKFCLPRSFGENPSFESNPIRSETSPDLSS
jgi:hypothetical protein